MSWHGAVEFCIEIIFVFVAVNPSNGDSWTK